VRKYGGIDDRRVSLGGVILGTFVIPGEYRQLFNNESYLSRRRSGM